MKLRFEDLLRPDPDLSIGKQQRLAIEQLREMVSQSATMNYFRLGDSIFVKGTRILLGVGGYFLADLRLLDALNDILSEISFPSIRVDVFEVQDVADLSDFKMSDYEKYIPGIGRFDIPIVGVWEDGVLAQKAFGAAAREVLTQYFPTLSSVDFFG